ncbi:MAG TPA: enoyl-CoA hydratase/isomerase family protein [Puia sp.]|jgi:3-hydroxyacyl-CoA dehydrogenase|nr:enoyl-CoA hydratase/isomerase family protein [Puia sp.]
MNRKTITIDWADIDTDRVAAEWAPIRAVGKVYLENASATVTDLGEGIGLIEFHTKANALNDEISDTIVKTCEEGSKRFGALVIGNTGKHFSAGANLAMILEIARNKDWTRIEATIRNLQRATMSIKYSRIPVVAAPFSSALGGGCEICLHSTLVVAARDTHLGLVEAGVGLIPSGGGTKELGLRAIDKGVWQGGEPIERLEPVLHQILTAKVAKSGEEARSLFLTPADGVAKADGPPLAIARRAALLLMARGYTVPPERTDIPVLGITALRYFREKIEALHDKGTITAHDALIGSRIAGILCGGDGPAGTSNEQHFLDLEREAFLFLLGTAPTQERIQYLLTNNKALHN